MKAYCGKREDYFKRDKFFEELKDDVECMYESFDFEECKKWAKNRIKELGFVSRYTHCNYSKSENWIEIDFGSYSTFIIFYDLSESDWKEFLGC